MKYTVKIITILGKREQWHIKDSEEIYRESGYAIIYEDGFKVERKIIINKKNFTITNFLPCLKALKITK